MAERGSTQHSARVDDELEHETESLVRGTPAESRAEEWRRMEPPADDEPLPDAVVSVDDVERRSILATSLRPSAFPGNRDRLLAVATEEHAADQVMEWLRALPAGREFVNVQDVWETLGGRPEERERHVAEPTHRPVEAAPGPSILSRVTGIARAGVEIGVGLIVEAVQEIRRRL